MVLKADVLAHNNRILLNQGTTVSDKHIKTLKSWGIMEVQVKDAIEQNKAVAENAVANPEFLKQAKEEMIQLFRHANPNDPVMKELFSLCVDRKINFAHGKKN